MNDQYCTISQYIECKTSLLEQIQAYDLILKGMRAAYLNAVTSGHLDEYQMDDGQMKIRAKYRSVSEMNKAMTGLQKLRQDCINQHNGRVTRLVGGNL